MLYTSETTAQNIVEQRSSLYIFLWIQCGRTVW